MRNNCQKIFIFSCCFFRDISLLITDSFYKQKQICIEEVGFSPPKPTATSTVYQSKNFLEVVTFRALQENLSRYRRIDKTTYLDRSTGELKTYRRKERSSTDQAAKCKRSYVVLRRILLANFTASRSELSNRLGHAQASTTLNIYAHALKSRDLDAAEKLDAALNF